MSSTTTSLELTAEMLAALEDEAGFLAASIADEAQSVEKAYERGESPSEVLKAQVPRLQLAIQVWESVESGRLDVIAQAFHLDAMAGLVETARKDELRELETARDYLREMIIRGPDPRDTESREQNITYYRERIERTTRLIRGQEAFLALAAAEKDRVARFVAEEESAG